MACACQKNREQFEVVRDGGTGKVMFTGGVQSTAVTVGRRYQGSVIRNKKTGEIVNPGTGALELKSATGAVLLRTDDAVLLAKVAAANAGSTARNTTTGTSIALATAAGPGVKAP